MFAGLDVNAICRASGRAHITRNTPRAAIGARGQNVSAPEAIRICSPFFRVAYRRRDLSGEVIHHPVKGQPQTHERAEYLFGKRSFNPGALGYVDYSRLFSHSQWPAGTDQWSVTFA